MKNYFILIPALLLTIAAWSQALQSDPAAKPAVTKAAQGNSANVEAKDPALRTTVQPSTSPTRTGDVNAEDPARNATVRIKPANKTAAPANKTSTKTQPRRNAAEGTRGDRPGEPSVRNNPPANPAKQAQEKEMVRKRDEANKAARRTTTAAEMDAYPAKRDAELKAKTK
jgi:hypothetical protein